MRKMYCCDASHSMYDDYYARQSGGEMPVFRGARYQRGHGLGNFFSGLKRVAVPLLQRRPQFLLPRLFKTGREIGNDGFRKRSIKRKKPVRHAPLKRLKL